MKSFKNNIYEELIADNRFIEWVSGNDKSDYEYWENWKDNHPKFQIEFEEAKKNRSATSISTSRYFKQRNQIYLGQNR